MCASLERKEVRLCVLSLKLAGRKGGCGGPVRSMNVMDPEGGSSQEGRNVIHNWEHVGVLSGGCTFSFTINETPNVNVCLFTFILQTQL